ncbi:MAG: GntR family transcriptional regulator [Verrucomicrobiales bacterium]|nr:GntR family transcriptional regulator [Verrucomicrobiales bacterium]
MPAATPTPTSPASKATVMRGLLTMLLRGECSEKDRLTEAMACEKFGTSRTPVREAFLELQALGLIELKRNCGAIVLPFGAKELQEIYDLRALLETAATRLATGRIPEQQLQDLLATFRHLFDEGKPDPDWRHDQELHNCIAAHCGNRRLAAEIARYGELIQTLREIVGEVSFDIHATSAEEHLEILEALINEDEIAAARAMAEHLGQASRSAVLAMETLRD